MTFVLIRFIIELLWFDIILLSFILDPLFSNLAQIFLFLFFGLSVLLNLNILFYLLINRLLIRLLRIDFIINCIWTQCYLCFFKNLMPINLRISSLRLRSLIMIPWSHSIFNNCLNSCIRSSTYRGSSLPLVFFTTWSIEVVNCHIILHWRIWFLRNLYKHLIFFQFFYVLPDLMRKNCRIVGRFIMSLNKSSYLMICFSAL